MILELIATGLLTQAVSHYGQKGLELLDAGVAGVAMSAAKGDAEARTKLNEALAIQARDEPVDGADGSTDFQRLISRLMEFPPRDEPQVGAMLAKFGGLLDGIFRAAHALPESLVAAPGWFHSDCCAVVLDARARPGSTPDDPRWEADAPLVSWANDDAFFEFDEPDAPGAFSRTRAAGTPRAAVIECVDHDQVHDVLARLQPALGRVDAAKQGWSTPRIAEVAEVDDDRVRTVTRLYERKVRMDGPASDYRRPGENIVDFRGRAKVGEADFEIRNPKGVRLLRENLAEQIIDHDRQQAEWMAL